MADEREQIVEWIEEANQAGAGKRVSCELLGLSLRTLQRWQKGESWQDGRRDAKHVPHNKLDDLERQRLLKIANQAEYANLSPNKLVPLLADEGIYVASESSFYRVLKQAGQLQHRQRSKPSVANRPEALTATAPNCIYSWDITYLPTLVRGLFFYLYLFMDIFSRKIVGWQVYENECSQHAADLIEDICWREGVEENQVTLHSDNGSPMKGATMLATLQRLGIIPSFSRPSVSNDNPYSESLFKTLKYRPEYPEKAFEGLIDARDWVEGFVHWYNEVHLHSAIKFVTPAQKHAGLDRIILANRHHVYQVAKAKKPCRWSGNTRNWDPVEEVLLNPHKSGTKNTKIKRVA